MQGDLFFLTQSPEFGNQQIPLAPGFYLFMTPLTVFFQDHALLLKVAAVLTDASSVFFVFYLVHRWTRDAVAGWLAAAVYALTPVTFLMISAGNIPNLFSQTLLLTLIVVVLANYRRMDQPAVWIPTVFLVIVAGVSHMGNLIVMETLLGAFAIGWYVFPASPTDRRAALFLVLAAGVGLVLSVALYYADFAGLLYGEFLGLVQKRFGGGLRVAGTLDFAKVPVAISAVVIAGGLLAVPFSWKRVEPFFRRAWLAWLAAAGIFVALAQFAGMYVRYNIFVLPVLGLGVGLGATWLGSHFRRLRAGYLLVAVYMAYVIWTGVWFWFNRVMFTYH